MAREGQPDDTPGEHGIERRLAPILAADVAGYSRLMGADEAVRPGFSAGTAPPSIRL